MTGTICQNCMHFNVCKYAGKMARVESKFYEVFKRNSTCDDAIDLGFPLKVILSCECFLCNADEEDGKCSYDVGAGVTIKGNRYGHETN